jgi:DNA-binding phage protein
MDTDFSQEDLEVEDHYVIESLDCEESIAGFIEAVLDDGLVPVSGAFRKAAEARFVNQTAKATGMDRLTLIKALYGDAVLDAADTTRLLAAVKSAAAPAAVG